MCKAFYRFTHLRTKAVLPPPPGLRCDLVPVLFPTPSIVICGHSVKYVLQCGFRQSFTHYSIQFAHFRHRTPKNRFAAQDFRNTTYSYTHRTINVVSRKNELDNI